MATLIVKVIRSLRSAGFRGTAKRVSEVYYEWRFGISTSQCVVQSQLGYEEHSCHMYTATDYRSFRKVMKHVELRKHKDVFLDYGSGMGRVLIMAATYPFSKVIGVELSPELNKVAFENIKRVKKKLKCKDIEIVEADAASYDIPSEVSLIYFYSPFSGAILSQVVDNIHKSLVEAPRELTIVYKNPTYFETEVKNRDWLFKRAEFTHLSKHKYVIYETKID